MKGMTRIKRGKIFKGLVMYSLFGRKGEPNYGPGHGRVIGGSVSSYELKDIVDELEAAAALRPDIEKPVWHNSLRQPPGEDLSDEKWVEIAERYLDLMGFKRKKTVYAIVKHEDEHIHLDVCRVDVNGDVYHGKNENLRSAKVIAQLEVEFGLTITKNVIDENGNFIPAEVKSLTKNEIDKAARTGERPPLLVMQEAIEIALRGKPPTTVFMERMEAAGITVFPNIASTGKFNGFAFEYAGVHKTASGLGSKYAWSKLKEKINYDKDRDGKELARRKKPGRDDTGSNRAPGDGRAAGNGDRPDSPSPSGDGSDGGEDSDAHRADRGTYHVDREAPGIGEAHAIVRKIAQPRLVKWKAERDAAAARKRRQAEEDELLEIYEAERRRKVKIAIAVRLESSRIVCADDVDWRSQRINPQRMKWLAVREEVLLRQYGQSSNHLVKMFRVSYNPPRREIVFKNAAAHVVDKGSLIRAREGNAFEIEAMIELAKLKRWKKIKVRGTDEFKAAAMKRALSAGFEVETENARDARMLAKIKAERAPSQDYGVLSLKAAPAPAPRPPGPGYERSS